MSDRSTPVAVSGTSEGRSQSRAQRRHPEGLHDFDSAAAYLNTSPRHVRRLWAERRIAGVKVGKAVRFTEADLLRFIERHRVEAVR